MSYRFQLLILVFLSPEHLEILVVATSQGRGVEVVGTAFAAGVTLQATVDFLHFLVELVGQVDAQRRTAQEETHAIAALDFNACRTWLAVAASAAEIAAQLTAVGLDAGAHFVIKRRRVGLERNEFVKFAFALYSPNRGHMVVLCEESVGGGGVVDEAAGQSFHGDESHVVGAAQLHYFLILFRSEVRKRELHGFVQAALDGFASYRKSMVCDANVQHFALTHSLLHGLVKTCTIAGLGTERRVVELVEVDVVGAQQTQTCFKVAPKTFGILGTGFGAYNHTVATVVKGFAEFFLAVGVKTCRIEIIHTGVQRLLSKTDGLSGRDALNGQSPETIARNHESAAS